MAVIVYQNQPVSSLSSKLPWNQVTVAACFLEDCPWHI